MKIVLGADHGGYALKEQLKAYLKDEKGYEVLDCGTDSEASCDYPVYAHAACDKIKAGEADLGILVCGTGIGMSMAANKIRGIRAALCSDCFSAKFTRAHNNANVMCLGARVIGPGLAKELVDIFLTTPFEGGRHQKRVDMLE